MVREDIVTDSLRYSKVQVINRIIINKAGRGNREIKRDGEKEEQMEGRITECLVFTMNMGDVMSRRGKSSELSAI